MLMHRLLLCLILLYTALCTVSAGAVDFYQIKKSHRLGEYQKSLPLLIEKAKLGYAPAQIALAEAYAKGYGTKIDYLNAYAWALMAKDQGHPLAESLYLDYRTRLSSRRAGKQLYQTLKSQYGTNALRQSLYPKIHSKAMPISPQPQAVKTPEPNFATSVYEQQDAFWTLIQFDINENGKTENINILASYPQHGHNPQIEQAIKQWQFKPTMDINNNPLRFDFQTRLISMYSQHNSFVGSPEQQQLLARAQNGHAQQQYILSKLLEFEVLSTNTGSALEWLLKAAINGYGKAQFELYQCTSVDSRCQQDQAKAMQWLKMAQNTGEPRTKMALVKAYMTAQGQDPENAHKMLEALVQSNHLPALILYAKLLATSTDKTVKNPEQAIKYARQAMALDNNHPQLLAIIAIAHYSLEQPDEGQALLMEAIREAEYRRWPIEYYVNLLEDYQRATLLQQKSTSKTSKQ